jgi:hypothetical protein
MVSVNTSLAIADPSVGPAHVALLLRREAVAQNASGFGWSTGCLGVLGRFRLGPALPRFAGALSGPCGGYLVAVEFGQVVRHHQ